VIDHIDIHSLTPSGFLRAFRSPGRPALITGAFDDVPEWSLDYLAGKLGTKAYRTRYYGSDHFSKPKREWSRFTEVRDNTLEEYATLITNGAARDQRIYFAAVSIGETEAAASIRSNFINLERRTGMSRFAASDINIWLGPANHTEPLHFDVPDGTLIQLRGAKRVTLFPPQVWRALYPFPFAKGPIPPWFSQVDLDHPDFLEFPLLAKALDKRLEIVVNQGETLFIPAYWWHEVSAEGHDYVCSVNRFWKVSPLWRNLVHEPAIALWLLSEMPQHGLPAYHALRKLRESVGKMERA
jgi:lysine-specific demethylase 8/hypoxia-inducible factor 1-alpha inhibitor (HIF hydroxylase)